MAVVTNLFTMTLQCTLPLTATTRSQSTVVLNTQKRKMFIGPAVVPDEVCSFRNLER